MEKRGMEVGGTGGKEMGGGKGGMGKVSVEMGVEVVGCGNGGDGGAWKQGWEMWVWK